MGTPLKSTTPTTKVSSLKFRSVVLNDWWLVRSHENGLAVGGFVETRIYQMEELSNQSHWWWFDNRRVPRRSPWLRSTLAALETKTKGMLRLIEEDADSFAQRAEMYYKKRPELVSMVEDFYREHRSLAEKLDMVKCKEAENDENLMECGAEEKSEVDDPDSQESDVDDPEEGGEEQEEEGDQRLRGEEIEEDKSRDRDEEKREAIRQLSIAVQILREENWMLRRRNLLMESSFRKKSGFLRLRERVLNACGWD